MLFPRISINHIQMDGLLTLCWLALLFREHWSHCWHGEKSSQYTQTCSDVENVRQMYISGNKKTSRVMLVVQLQQCPVQMVPYIPRKRCDHTPLEESPLVFLQVVDPHGSPYVRLMAWWWSFMTRAGHKEPHGYMRATQTHFGMTSLAVSSEVGQR